MTTLFGGISEYEITNPRPCTCGLCDRRCPGTIRFELYGGALMVCEPCFHDLESNKPHPYSKVMDRFAMKACGYHVNVNNARTDPHPESLAFRRRRFNNHDYQVLP